MVPWCASPAETIPVGGRLWSTSGLAACKRLESLTLNFKYSWLGYQRYGYRCFSEALHTYADVLSQQPALPIRNLTLKFPVYFEDPMRILSGRDCTPAWNKMDEALSSMLKLDVVLDVPLLRRLSSSDQRVLSSGLESLLGSVGRTRLEVRYSVVSNSVVNSAGKFLPLTALFCGRHRIKRHRLTTVPLEFGRSAPWQTGTQGDGPAVEYVEY